MTGRENLPSDLALLRLLQLVSPSLPVGAYAYSQGIEQATERGLIHDQASLEVWIRGVLRSGVAGTDLPLVILARRAVAIGDWETVTRLSSLSLALRETAELRAEERQMGASLARVLSGLGVASAKPFMGSDSASYAVLFGLAGAHYDIDEVALASGYAFAWAENLILGATRLLPLGQNDAQRLLARVGGDIPAAVAVALEVEERDVGISLVGHALVSAWHEQQYSRLFRS